MNLQTSITSELVEARHPLKWKQVLEFLVDVDQNLQKAGDFVKLLPSESLEQPLSNEELKQQILSHAPNVENAARSIKELYLRKVKNASS